jgi:4a-hydroxytetrahydrobiopterin dehydratase
MSRPLSTDEITEQLASLPGWTGSTDVISRAYAFPDFPTAITGVDRVAIEAEEMDHHPDIDIRWRTVTFALSTHSAGGVTQLDIELAHRIRLIAEELSAQ